MSKVLRALMIMVVPTTVIVGQSNGVTISCTIRNSLAPSMRAASRTSVLIDFRLAEMITIQKPVILQMPTKIKAGLLVVELTSQGTGWAPNVAKAALRVPVCTLPGGW